MLIKIIIGALLIFIVFNLARAGVAMVRQQESTLPMSHFLGRRVLYSAIALGLILLAIATGLITPNPRPY
ncbi:MULTISPECIES: DUF2909 domain-containing protein [Alishewanella]|jgi:hypothetical protein|uniref:DUF2909 domain-containing protein n=1 Tax=Alishewanella jeotgali KCTC 22429 TaxID=1129374 RepID=H3ZF20_9ALTE|nr:MULTISPECIES: DUF2909 domain-containing protein [Alishewanella]EHR40838.1 hypothetical protein AJE_09774 [Alishewanella jeotgali KCTC 22429]MCT8125218.1 DUF2909 domain-containing protein [Alishewanella sp. BS5-314]